MVGNARWEILSVFRRYDWHKYLCSVITFALTKLMWLLSKLVYRYVVGCQAISLDAFNPFPNSVDCNNLRQFLGSGLIAALLHK